MLRSALISALLQEDLDGSIAHARMLAECGVIQVEEADQLVSGLEQVRQEAASGQFQPGLELMKMFISLLSDV